MYFDMELRQFRIRCDSVHCGLKIIVVNYLDIVIIIKYS